MTMPVFRTVNMPMGFVVLLPFSTSFSTPENAVMHPVLYVYRTIDNTLDVLGVNRILSLYASSYP